MKLESEVIPGIVSKSHHLLLEFGKKSWTPIENDCLEGLEQVYLLTGIEDAYGNVN